MPSVPAPKASIVICTYGRPESLNDCLESLANQTFKDFEVILITEKGDLSALRDQGLRAAVGECVSFIDDDVYCPPTWLQAVVNAFEEEGVVGVTGPTEIPSHLRSNRDIFKFRLAKRIYDHLFLGKDRNTPSFLSSCGAPSTRSNYPIGDYQGKADYLEACNMSVKRKEALDAGGFDKFFIRTSEWCEVDLALKLRGKGILRFSGEAGLLHKPSKSGIYTSRLSTEHRWKNFIYFQRKWQGKCIDRNLRTYIYRVWVWTYFKIKNLTMI